MIIRHLHFAVAALLISSLNLSAEAQVTQILDASGDGAAATLNTPLGVAVDNAGNVFVVGGSSENLFKITPAGVVTEFVEFPGFANPASIRIDGTGNLFVLSWSRSEVFKVTPAGDVSIVLTEIGDGVNPYDGGEAIAVGGDGVAYASGSGCCTNVFANVFRLPPGGPPELVLDNTAGGLMTVPLYTDIAVDSVGNLYAAANQQASVLKVTPAGVVSIVLDQNIFPGYNTSPRLIATDLDDNAIVSSDDDRVHKIEPNGTVTEIFDGVDPAILGISAIAVRGPAIYLAGWTSDNVVQLLPNGTMTEVLGPAGDGVHPFEQPDIGSIALDFAGNIYATGSDSDNAFKVLLEATFELSRDEEKCINALNKGLRKVSRAQGIVVRRCVQDETKGKLTSLTVDECLTADRKQKVAKAQARVLSDDGKKCAAVTPPIGATDGATVGASAAAGGRALTTDLFGPTLEGVVLLHDGATKDTAACQAGVLKAVVRCQDVRLKEFAKCKKKGLKTDSIISQSGIAACISADATGKIARACAPVSGKLRSAVDGCLGVDLTTAFPGSCSAGDGESVAQCLSKSALCRVCRAATQADALDVIDCDALDDGLINTSCGPVCGDTLVEGSETCDDGNVISGDGCSSTCDIEP